MSKFKSILFALAFSLVGCPVAHSKENNETQNVALIVADAGMSITERKVRDAAVRVFTHGGGHGSGSYIKHKDYLFVLTAQHVADGPLYSDYRVKKGEIIGVLWGVDVEYYPGIAVVEEMIWVIPIQKLNMDEVVANSCKIAGVQKMSPRFCRK